MSVIAYSDSIVTGPEIEPIDLDQVKRNCKVTTTAEDSLFDGWISGARQRFEAESGRHPIRVLRERRYHAAFPTLIELPAPPLLQVVSIQYIDGDGTLTTLSPSDYAVEPEHTDLRVDAEPAVIYPASGVTWPSVTAIRNAVRVRYYAGYGRTPGEVPEIIRTYLYGLVEAFHKFRSPLHVGDEPMPVPLGYDDFVRNLRWSGRCKYQPSDGVEVTA